MASGAARRLSAGTPSARRTRSRPAPRRGVRWDRLARLSLLVVLAVIVLSYAGPATDYIKAWHLARETRAEVQQLRQDNERLRARTKRLATDRQVELEARKMGMARPGERVYVVHGLPR
jgi:cell division protein FtsB